MVFRVYGRLYALCVSIWMALSGRGRGDGGPMFSGSTLMRGSRRERGGEGGGGKAAAENPRCIISGCVWSTGCVCFVFIRRINSSIVGFSVGCNVICYFGQILFHWINSNDCIIIVDYQNGLCWHYSKQQQKKREQQTATREQNIRNGDINMHKYLLWIGGPRLRYIFYVLGNVCECCGCERECEWRPLADAGHLSHYLFINILVDFIGTFINVGWPTMCKRSMICQIRSTYSYTCYFIVRVRFYLL